MPQGQELTLLILVTHTQIWGFPKWEFPSNYPTLDHFSI